MPPKKAAASAENAGEGDAGAGNNGTELSISEYKLCYNILKHLKTKPEINWARYVEEVGGNPKSCMERWRVLRNKYCLTWDSAPAGSGTPSRKGKKALAATTDDLIKDEDADGSTSGLAKSAPTTPAKRQRKKSVAATPATTGGRKRSASVSIAAFSPAAFGGVDELAGEEEDGESPSKKVKGRGKVVVPMHMHMTEEEMAAQGEAAALATFPEEEV
ncbi:hypothetical protein N0V88_000412 [Collariella sp. IMI 366227]|nr:hypothetical protein N0V88_000412 [Collariella sp. IMI 366227]